MSQSMTMLFSAPFFVATPWPLASCTWIIRSFLFKCADWKGFVR